MARPEVRHDRGLRSKGARALGSEPHWGSRGDFSAPQFDCFQTRQGNQSDTDPRGGTIQKGGGTTPDTAMGVSFTIGCPRSKTHPQMELTVKSTTPKAPAHLADATRAWWRSVVREYKLEPHHLRLLQAAAEAWDRAVDAQSLLARDGLVIAGREGGMRPHPAVAIRRDAEVSFARLLRELDLDTEAPSDVRTAPPALRSNRRGGGYAG